MLRWSINLFRVFGIQLSVHVSFLLLLAYAAFEGWRDSGLAGAGWSLVLTVMFFVCVILHELGHSLTAQRYGVKIPRILLLPIGGMAEFDRIPRQPSAELLITMAGPAVNFLIAAVLWLAVGVPAGWPLHAEYPDTAAGVMQLLLGWNLVMGTFNLLPVFPMDGGRIFRALLALKLPYLRATYWAVLVGKILALAFAGLALFYFNRPMSGILFVFIYWAGEAEYRQTLRREQEARYWTEMTHRIREMEARGAEPPAPPVILHGPN